MTEVEYRHICIAVHGDWGAGKTWFGDTSPGPRLILDCEGGSLDTPSPKVFWDMRDPLPSKLAKDTSVIVDITEWDQVDTAIKLLQSGAHPFNSVVVDSLTEMQDLCKAKISDGVGELFDHQKWGKLLAYMADQVKVLRNLSRKSAVKQVNVVMVMGSNTEVFPATPLLEGGLRRRLPGYVDILGFMRNATTPQGDPIRVMQIVSDDKAQTKCRLHEIGVANGAAIAAPDMRTMIKQVNT